MGVFDSLYSVYQTGRVSAAVVAESLLRAPDAERYAALLRAWSDRVVHAAKIDLVVRGTEHLPHGEACVVMANHQSFYDIPVLIKAVPEPMTFVAKAELFRVPLFGRAMTMAGVVRVDRKDRSRSVASLHSAVEQLRNGRHIYIAPEGTRSHDGRLGPFKSGGFRMALEAGARIVPVAIDGTRHVLPPRSFLVHPGHRVVVTVQPPIDPKEYGLERRKELMEAVRKAIAGPLGQ